MNEDNERGPERRSQAHQNDITDRDLISIHKEIEALQKEVSGIKAERDKALRWGLVLLGSAVIAMAGWIFTFITGHLK